jgi:hypothetical protein
MSRIVVDLDKVEKESNSLAAKTADASKPQSKAGKKRGIWKTIFKTILALFTLLLLIAAIGGYFYWQELRRSPAYSLALVVDAARRDDKQALAKLVDTDRIVDNFVPQITDKAVELYGRGLPQSVIQKLARVASPALPALKDHARVELPRLIREKTKSADNVPFFLVAIGAWHNLEIQQEGDIATVKSTMPDRPLELKMQKVGDIWQVIEIRDEPLARKIAEKMGQDIIAAANNGAARAGEMIGVPNLNEIIKKAEEFLR